MLHGSAGEVAVMYGVHLEKYTLIEMTYHYFL
jgi:hypothetical protein